MSFKTIRANLLLVLTAMLWGAAFVAQSTAMDEIGPFTFNGTRMFIVSDDGQYIYGIATAEDCGGGVKGNHIDLYFDTTYECFQYGVRTCTVYFLG